MNKSINEELSQLRKLYLEELAKKEEKYRADIEEIEEKIKDAEEYDYSESYTSRYESSLGFLERIYEEIATTHSKTKGISFKVYDYITTLSPNGLGDKNVEVFFLSLVKECKGAISQILKSNTPEDDIEPLKVFCQCLVDLRYIVANKEWLIEQSGIPSALKEKALEPLNDEKDARDKEYEEETKLECLDCYEELMSFKAQVVERKSTLSKRMLGNQPITPKDDYKFLMGFYKTEIESDLVKFAEDVLSLSQDQLSQEPIYFELSGEHSTILINAKKSYFKSAEFTKLMSSIYFSFVTNMPSRELRFAGIELGTSKPVIGGLGRQVEACFDGAIVDKVANDTGMFSLINKVKETTMRSAEKYTISFSGGIFEYNQLVSENRDPFILFALNHYPCGFASGRERGYESLKEMATEYGNNGVICVICQAIDEEFNEKTCPVLTADELNADCIEITDDKQLYNGKEADINICTPELLLSECWKNVTEHLKSTPALWLSEVIKTSKEEEKKAAIPLVDEEIRVPLGNRSGSLFELSMKPCSPECFGMVIGGTGSGKSSFLHTFILSTANRYTPEEVRFCLADFKSSEASPEFSQYRKCEKENLYMPHIEYLMAKGKFESIYDLFERIDNMANERARIVEANGIPDVRTYNKSDDVVAGNKPRMPYVFYVIDEYNVMFDRATGAEKNNIAKKLRELVKKVRSAGIGIILSGQHVDNNLDDVTVAQFNTRISLGQETDSDYASLMKTSTSIAREDLGFITAPGLAILTTNSGKTRDNVRLAFSGATGCEGQRRLAKEIRERYRDYKQIVGGSEELYLIQDMEFEEEFEHGTLFKLPVGVGSASMIPVQLEFSKDDGTNYFVYASENKLFRIERGAMFSFLNIDIENKGEVKYLGFPLTVNKCLSKYFEKIPVLKDAIATYTTKQDMANQIVALSKLLKERKAQFEKNQNEVNFEPTLTVMHQVDWLLDKDTSWLNAQHAEKESGVHPQLPDNLKKALEGKNKATKYIMSYKTRQETRGGSDFNEGFLTVSDYRDALVDIFDEGTRYGIYLLICSSEYSKIQSLLISETEKKEAATELYSVYGSFKEKEEKIRDYSASKNCAYVCPKKINTRLFNFSIEENKDWWNKLENRLKKGF